MIDPPKEQTGLKKNKKVSKKDYERYLVDFFRSDYVSGLYPINAEDEERAKNRVRREEERLQVGGKN